MLKKLTQLFICLLAIPFTLTAQVTTGSISGTIKDAQGADLAGATIEALHEPSGSVYRSVSGKNGVYNIPSLRVGGPYKLTITFIGFKKEEITDIYVQLGEATKVNTGLTNEAGSLTEVVVAGTARKGSLISKDRKGTSTNINRRLIAALPTLSRNITDFTKLTPQSNGTSFAGQDNRFINLTVDGSIFNNSFGLQALPGSQTNASPISVDAIEEIQVNVSPYSVKDAGFTGASINAVTRSGTNTFHGSAFYNNRNQNLVGDKAGSDGKTPVTILNFDVKQYGVSLGGPIIKNKLFFFANYENEKRTDPATAFVADNGSNSGQPNVSRVKTSELDALSTFLKTNLNYDPGVYQGHNFITKSSKILAKIDWNLSDKNKFSLRFNSLRSYRDIGASASGSLTGGRASSVNTMNFSNNNYEQHNDINSLIGQLNTRFSNKVSNEVIFGWTANRDYRDVKGSLFPLIDILDGTNTDRSYISFGAEPFTPNNVLNTDTWQASDNITFYNGKHTTSAGVNFESFKFFNQFTPQIQGFYIFNSLADFYTSANAYLANNNMAQNPVNVRRYILGYSNLANNQLWNAVTKTKNIGAYVQDEWQIEDNFSITYGVRFDVPIFNSNGVNNPQVDGYNFVDEKGNPTKVSTSQLPSTKVMINPRFGFNYDVKGDKKTQLRGGLGLFSGRPAFVFISNAVGNNGMQAGQISQDNTKNYPFSPNITRNIPTNIVPGTPAASYNIAPIEKDFRFPQIFRTNFAVDHKLYKNIVFSTEFLFTQSLSNIFYYNANQKAATTAFSGPDTRPRFAGSAGAVRINPNVNDATVLASRPYGQNTNLTFKLEKPLGKGLSWMVAYNFGRTKDFSSASTIAFSSFTSTRTVNGNNLPDFSYSDNDARHRVIGNITYRKEIAKTAAIQLSLFGQSQNIGRFSYAYSGDLNGDGISGNDLMYIPKDQSQFEMNFEQYTVTINNVPTVITVQQQKDAFEAYIQQDNYLSKHRGEIAKRNGALQPMLSKFDLSALVELFRNIGKQRHTIQFRADIFNVGNMINSKWGVANVINNGSPIAARPAVNNVPVFRMNLTNNNLNYQTYRKGTSIADVWQGQLGIRYIF
jgi:Carboxypeptidase regulatory-like domain/TonB dependent receptor